MLSTFYQICLNNNWKKPSNWCPLNLALWIHFRRNTTGLRSGCLYFLACVTRDPFTVNSAMTNCGHGDETWLLGSVSIVKPLTQRTSTPTINNSDVNQEIKAELKKKASFELISQTELKKNKCCFLESGRQMLRLLRKKGVGKASATGTLNIVCLESLGSSHVCWWNVKSKYPFILIF